MKLLPVALDVRGRACLIVGGGPVGARKLLSLLECEAEVTLIAPDLCESARRIASRYKYLCREWRSGDCAGFSIIWACTPSLEVNEAIAREARESGAWCGISGPGEGGDLSGAAAIYRGEVCIAISTSGASPALSRHLKERVATAVGSEYETLLLWMGEARGELKARVQSQDGRANVWRQVLVSDVLELLRQGQEDKARKVFEAVVSGAPDAK